MMNVVLFRTLLVMYIVLKSTISDMHCTVFSQMIVRIFKRFCFSFDLSVLVSFSF